MGNSVNRQKMEQAVKYLKDLEIDLWLILTSEGSDPSIPLITGVGTVGIGAFLISNKGEKVAICSSIDAQDLEESGLFDRVVKYSHATGAEPVIKETILSFNPKRIALNYSLEENLADGLTVGRYRWLLDLLGDSYRGEFLSSESFLSLLRSIKTPLEIERIQKAVDITIEIYEEVFKRLKVGMTESEIGSMFVEELEKRNVVNGVDRRLSMPIVMKERIAHRPPGNAVIEHGDLLIVDFSVEYEGYVSDIARTIYFLRPDEDEAPPQIRKVFQAIYDAISLAGEALSPGAVGYEVDQIARNHLLSKGLPEITHATGHQIGRDVHDGGTLLGPRWERYGKAPYGPVLEGMVFTLEPTVFMDGGIHFIIEENVVVTNDGPIYLSKRQENLIYIRS